MMKFLKKVKNPFKELCEEANLRSDIRRSLFLMLLGNLFGNMTGIICTSSTTAMVGLATSLGADDLTFGILTAITQVAAIMQIPFSMLVNRTHKRKRYLLTFGLGSRILWLFFGFIPVVIPAVIPGISINLRIWALVFLLGIICFCGAAVQVCWFPWFSDLCPLTIRSRWLASRNVILSMANILVGFVVALLLDHLPEDTKYIIIFLMGGTFGILDMLCFAGCTEEYSAPPKKLDLKGIVTDIFKNKPFFHFMIFWTVWSFATDLASVYMTPYAMNVMGLTNTQIIVFATIAACLISMLFIQRWGRAIFHFGGKNVLTVCCTVCSLVPVIYLFATPGSVLTVLLFNVIGSVFWSGSDLAATSMELSCSPDDERPSYIAFFSCIVAIVGVTLGSLTGGALLKFMEKKHILEGCWFDRYKLLFAFDILLRISATLIFLPKLKNDTDKTPRDLLNAILNKERRIG